MSMRKTFFLAHDPGGVDVTRPLAAYFADKGLEHTYYCCGPAGKLVAEQDIEADEAIENIEKAARSGNISLLVTGTSWNSQVEVQALDLCKNNGIPTAVVLDYWNSYATRFRQVDGTYIFPDYYIVMDELAVREAIEEGVPQGILYPLGHPGLDRFVSRHSYGSLPIVDQQETLRCLFLSQPLSQLYGESLGYTEQQVLEDCIDAAGKIAKVQMSVKFHPKDNAAYSSSYKDMTVQGQLEDLIPGFDVVIGMNTIGLLHTILMGKEAICYQPNLRGPDYSITNKLGLTKPVSSKDQLVQELSALLRSHYKTPIQKLDAWPWMDGKSTERIASFIQEVISR